eukprot:CAMPEP_0182531940 /NCGR_PEP_ID=MMETSP1323-20130603/10252_1 /TAXON_ID=236787 /ORGANISM="Florenciella parvula, Strain RCC1693" /LENGTH=47 /DNA_ID= /DNA_START= /DNA_END= /DNA_ORIENTATION=
MATRLQFVSGPFSRAAEAPQPNVSPFAPISSYSQESSNEIGVFATLT